MEKKAVVLSGGGSRGSYQAGVWKALQKLHYRYQIVTGTSVGALNGALMVQRDYKKCLRLWENIDFSQLFVDTFPSNTDGIIGKTKVYQTYATSFFKHGGMDLHKFEQLIDHMYSPYRFFHSSIDFGMITYNMKNHKGVAIQKKDMKEDTVPSYIIASASCFPAFPIKKIDGESYIDGGYADNLPINLAIDLGATEIVAVDLNAIGRKVKIKDTNVKVTLIEPRNQIASFLVFQKEHARKAIAYGYNDTMKVFGKLEGNCYTFYKFQLKKEYNKRSFIFFQVLEKQFKNQQSNFFDHLLKISIFRKLKEDGSGKAKEKFFYENIETIGKILKIDDTKIYKMKPYFKEALKKLDKIDSLDLKKIEEKIKTKNIKSLFGTATILRFLYDKIEKKPENCNKYALLFPKEFIASIYLHILNRQYSIIERR